MGGLAGHLLIGGGMPSGWGKSKANTFSLRVGGETGYTVPNSHNAGEGRTTGVRFLCSCMPRPSLVLSALLSLNRL